MEGAAQGAEGIIDDHDAFSGERLSFEVGEQEFVGRVPGLEEVVLSVGVALEVARERKHPPDIRGESGEILL